MLNMKIVSWALGVAARDTGTDGVTAAAILRERHETLERGARELLVRETLGEEDLRKLYAPLSAVVQIAGTGTKESLHP